MPLAIEAASNTPQWYAARRGCLGASRMRDVLAVSKRDGKPLEARTRLLMELVAERMTGIATEHFVTAAMQWGIDNEPAAVAEYEEQSGNVAIYPAGWVRHPTIEWFGATPEASIGEDGILEVKCPTTPVYIQWLRDGIVPEEHRPQMLSQLSCTRRQWVDFVAFDPRIQHGPKSFIRRLEPKPGEIEAIEDAARTFLADVDRLFVQVTEGFNVK